jgi:hypothetical protein
MIHIYLALNLLKYINARAEIKGLCAEIMVRNAHYFRDSEYGNGRFTGFGRCCRPFLH